MSEAAATGPLTAAEVWGWVGYGVDDAGGSSVGQVRGLFVDAQSGAPTWLVIKHSRFGGALVVAPVADCAAGGGRVWVAHGREAIRAAPIVDPSRPLLREHELTICSHFGIGERVGRAAEVVGLGPGAITSQPSS